MGCIIRGVAVVVTYNHACYYSLTPISQNLVDEEDDIEQYLASIGRNPPFGRS